VAKMIWNCWFTWNWLYAMKKWKTTIHRYSVVTRHCWSTLWTAKRCIEKREYCVWEVVHRLKITTNRSNYWNKYKIWSQKMKF